MKKQKNNINLCTEDKEDLDLFIFCMYFLALELFLGLLFYIYMHF